METTKWIADPAHSEIQFKAKHLMLTTVTGYFRQFEIIAETSGDDFTKASKILCTAEIGSIDTSNEQRDTHLKSADFFSQEKYPQLRFEGTNLEKKGDHYALQGDLTIRNITKPITLDVEFHGIVTDPYQQTKAGFSVEGKIKRKEFELMWDAVTEAGQIVVSNEIRILAEVQLIKQAEKREAKSDEEVVEVEKSGLGV